MQPTTIVILHRANQCCVAEQDVCRGRQNFLLLAIHRDLQCVFTELRPVQSRIMCTHTDNIVELNCVYCSSFNPELNAADVDSCKESKSTRL